MQREGHARVPLGHEEKGVRLGVWMSKQWTEFQGKYLSEARKVQLADAGVEWTGGPPPASGVVSSRHLNERKWDEGRGAKLAAGSWKAREFDAGKPASEGKHWAEYDAECDPHTRQWLVRQRAHGRCEASSPPPDEPYIPHGHPPVKGLDFQLATRLKLEATRLKMEHTQRSLAQARHAREALPTTTNRATNQPVPV